VLGRPQASADYNFSERDKTNRKLEEAGYSSLMCESLSEQEKKIWLEEASTMHDWVVWCKSKKGLEAIHSFELSWKEIFSNYD